MEPSVEPRVFTYTEASHSQGILGSVSSPAVGTSSTPLGPVRAAYQRRRAGEYHRGDCVFLEGFDDSEGDGGGVPDDAAADNLAAVSARGT